MRLNIKAAAATFGIVSAAALVVWLLTDMAAAAAVATAYAYWAVLLIRDRYYPED